MIIDQVGGSYGQYSQTALRRSVPQKVLDSDWNFYLRVLI